MPQNVMVRFVLSDVMLLAQGVALESGRRLQDYVSGEKLGTVPVGYTYPVQAAGQQSREISLASYDGTARIRL